MTRSHEVWVRRINTMPFYSPQEGFIVSKRMNGASEKDFVGGSIPAGMKELRNSF